MNNKAILIVPFLLFSLFLTGCGDQTPPTSADTQAEAEAVEVFDPETFDVTEKEHMDFIKSVFAQRQGVPIEEVELTVEKSTNTHMRGIVSMGETSGAFLVGRLPDTWVVMFDAEGTFPCDAVEGEGFADDMISDCVSESE